MTQKTLGCAMTLLLLAACGGAEKPAAAPSKSATARSGAEESCQSLSQLLCDKSQGDADACEAMKAAIELLPPKSCEEALKDPSYIEARLLAQKAICQQLMERLCTDLGEKTGACALVREQVPNFDGKRCQGMLGQYDDVLAELRQLEVESKPLALDDQKAIAAVDAPAFGPSDAKVTLVLFSDFECPYCGKAAQVADHVKANFGSQVRFVFRQFPLSFHKHAGLAAEAALLAHASGKFWEFHDQLFANQEHLEVDALTGYAKSVGLDPKSVRAQLDSHVYEAKVKADIALGERVHVRGTPTLFINGKRSQNATNAEVVASEVTTALAE